MEHSRFQTLFSPGAIGTMKLKNRIVFAPMGTNLCKGGFVSQRLKGLHEAISRGGVALDIVESSLVGGVSVPHALAIDDDKFVPGLSELAGVIKRNGAKAAIQIMNGLIMPQPGQEPTFGLELPRELTKGEIENMVGRFVQGARRAKQAGFDAIEIHGGHINAVSQFLSGAWNRRRDEYGGSPLKRIRLLVDIFQAVRAEVGREYPVWCRISVFEPGLKGGRTLKETLEQAPLIEKASADAIHISVFGFYNYRPVFWVMSSDVSGVLLSASEAIRRVVSVPVIAVNNISPEVGELALRERQADFIALGRQLFVDPELPNKLASGRRSEVRPCILCNHCIETVATTDGVECTVNPALGREEEFQIRPAPGQKKVLIVGGGPAGMEAARVSALRGHDVTLYEKEHTLGGQMNAASAPPGRNRIRALSSYMKDQLRTLGVKIVAGKRFSREHLDMVNPEVVVVASGVKPLIPEIPGLKLAKVVFAEDVILGRVEVGKMVVVVGGERVGCETALLLAEKGKIVTITRRGPHLATRMDPDQSEILTDRLDGKGSAFAVSGQLMKMSGKAGTKAKTTKPVSVMTGVTYLGATERGLIVLDARGRLACIEADTIVLAAGSVPDADLNMAVKGEAREVHFVGDCVQPRGIREAIAEGWSTACRI